MAVGGGEEEEQGQAGAATEQCMDTIAQQECPSVVVRRMPQRRIRVTAAPGQDGGAVDDEIAPADEAAVERQADEDDEQALTRRGAGLGPPTALLGGAGHPRTALTIRRQTAGEREGGPGHQPIMQVLIREAPQRAQQVQ